MNINIGDKRYIISDAAKMIDVESHVLRYWEEELEVEVPRNEMGHRYYTDYYIELFKKIKELKDSGFQLKAIKMLLPELMDMNASGKSDSIGALKDELFGKLISMGENSQTESDESRGITHDNDEECHNDVHSHTNEDVSRNGRSGERLAESADRENHKTGAPQGEVSQDNAPQGEISHSGTSQGEQGTQLSKVGTENISEKIGENSKLHQFQMIITEVVSNALKENTSALGQEVSEIVSDNVIKEMDYLMNLREKQEEERFKKLDETIRSYQNSNREKNKANKGLLSKFKRGT